MDIFAGKREKRVRAIHRYFYWLHFDVLEHSKKKKFKKKRRIWTPSRDRFRIYMYIQMMLKWRIGFESKLFSLLYKAVSIYEYYIEIVNILKYWTEAMCIKHAHFSISMIFFIFFLNFAAPFLVERMLYPGVRRVACGSRQVLQTFVTYFYIHLVGIINLFYIWGRHIRKQAAHHPLLVFTTLFIYRRIIYVLVLVWYNIL